MSTYFLQPGARSLWCLRRRASDVRCILDARALPVEVRIIQDQDLVLTEIFPEEWLALNWANAYRTRLEEHGWHANAPNGDTHL